ncbi:MAG: hypothetical protein Q4G22_06785 [Paracoccus sp. (in: a-proteobacteria)]|uniref:hypothetical protein n=1 Tax=Paracoccus sp. TaxID=267 RepID=UPI0026DEBC48|nr:hypothetical protein [Paracoccus sp. (in: a-proteobacteria)]MDO5631527.1 hypothetical protein [Paracoccus sp. (in: a-proteobacteria)]
MIETLSHIVTALGLPFAILVYWLGRRRDRENDEREIYERITSDYNEFLILLLDHADLKIWTHDSTKNLNAEQQERLTVIFGLLVSLFERAWLLSWYPDMTVRDARRWASWENYMRDWCRREDFARNLPELLKGHEAQFIAYFQKLVDDEARKAAV